MTVKEACVSPAKSRKKSLKLLLEAFFHWAVVSTALLISTVSAGPCPGAGLSIAWIGLPVDLPWTALAQALSRL